MMTMMNWFVRGARNASVWTVHVFARKGNKSEGIKRDDGMSSRQDFFLSSPLQKAEIAVWQINALYISFLEMSPDVI